MVMDIHVHVNVYGTVFGAINVVWVNSNNEEQVNIQVDEKFGMDLIDADANN
jgi:hypothetical protein